MKATDDYTVGRVAMVFFSAACVSADFLYLTAWSTSLLALDSSSREQTLPAVAQRRFSSSDENSGIVSTIPGMLSTYSGKWKKRTSSRRNHWTTRLGTCGQHRLE